MSRKIKNNKPQPDEKPNDLSRRNLLKSTALFGAAAVSSGAATQVIAAERSTLVEAPARPVTREALEVLTAAEAETLEAICDCLIPSDANGPGAKEARASHYIDRSLASHNASLRQDYLVGLSAINDYARQTRGKPFHELIRDQQNSILLAVQANKISGFTPSGSGFFNMLRDHTIEGTFGDPYYGGNQDFVGWDMLRYPGVRLSTTPDDVARGSDLPPNHRSAYDNVTYTKTAATGRGEGGDHA